MNIFTRISKLEKEVVSLSKRTTSRVNIIMTNSNTNAIELLETDANLVEAVVDEFNAIVGEDE